MPEPRMFSLSKNALRISSPPRSRAHWSRLRFTYSVSPSMASSSRPCRRRTSARSIYSEPLNPPSSPVPRVRSTASAMSTHAKARVQSSRR